MIRSLAILCSLFAFNLMPLFGAPWTEDFEAAKKASASSGLPILVDVTGSDWCPPCQLMEAEVFSLPSFLSRAQQKYVLLRLDFPRNQAQNERLRVQNKGFADRYPFEGFPTYLILDAQGTLIGKRTGYVPGGVASFFAMAEGLAAQKPVLFGLVEAVKKAPAGAERAKAQDALFKQAEAWGLEAQYGDLPLKIVQEDKDGKAGLKVRYQVYNAYQRLLMTWAQQSDHRKAVDDFSGLVERAAPWPDLQQKILFTKALVLWNALEDETGARDALRQAKALGPETVTGQRAWSLLDQLP